MKLSRLFNSLPKKLAAGGIVALAVMFPVAVMAANTVHLEGAMGVANVTAGETTYTASTNATFDQVVKFQVYYHNTELPDSGKNAQNLRVKIVLPTAAGTKQVASTTISADNANTVTDTATVNLNRADARLQYIAGSAVWRHNTGTNDNVTWTETKVSDTIVTGGTGLVLEDEKPCYNFAATVTVLARVVVPATQVTKEVRAKGTTNWTTNLTANAGDTVQYLITYKNTGNTDADDVIVRDNMPAYVTYVPGSTVLRNSNNPDGVKYDSDAVTDAGIVVGDYLPGGIAYVMFDAKLPAADKLACGDNMFRNVGVAQPKGENEVYNTADVHVKKDCTSPPTNPVYSCDLLTLSQQNKTVTATVQHTAKDGATYKSTSINWGDGTTNEESSHTYSKDGTYNVVATVNVSVNGEDKAVTNDKCKQPVTITTPAKPEYSCQELVVTPGEGRSATAVLSYHAAGGATFKTATLDWGDGSTPLTTDQTSANYTYAADGTYTVTAKVLFSVDGKDVYAADNKDCVKTVTITTPTTPETPETPETPGELPNTGAGSVIGIFAGVVIASAVGYRLLLGRKLARR